MNLLKKLTALALCLVLVLALVPATANAATSGTCGANLTWKLDSAGTLTISGTGPMNNFDYTGAPWTEQYESIKKIVINSGVTTIGDCAFSECFYVTAATIPSGVTTIGKNAFDGCFDLKSITIPASVTSIDNAAFAWCTSLTSVTIPAGVTFIGERPFDTCESLQKITVDAKNTNYSNDSYGVLFNNNKTELIQAPGALTGSYTVPGSVTSINPYAFSNCVKLNSVNISSGVKTIGESAFLYCENLTKVTIPSTVTTIGNRAFAESGLIELTIPAGVTSIGFEAFDECKALKRFTVDAKNKEYSSDSYGVLFNKNKTELIQAPCAMTGRYTAPSGLVTICSEAFAWCENLTAVKLPETVTTIGFGAFTWCAKLKMVEIPTSVTHIDWSAFSESGLTDVYYTGTKAQWNAIIIEEDNEPLLDANIHYQSAMPDTQPGDMNNDGTLDTNDAVYLLLNIMFGAEDYPVSAGANLNLNGDGSVDTNDAVYLLLHVMFGAEDYPI